MKDYVRLSNEDSTNALAREGMIFEQIEIDTHSQSCNVPALQALVALDDC